MRDVALVHEIGQYAASRYAQRLPRRVISRAISLRCRSSSTSRSASGPEIMPSIYCSGLAGFAFERCSVIQQRVVVVNHGVAEQTRCELFDRDGTVPIPPPAQHPCAANPFDFTAAAFMECTRRSSWGGGREQPIAPAAAVPSRYAACCGFSNTFV